LRRRIETPWRGKIVMCGDMRMRLDAAMKCERWGKTFLYFDKPLIVYGRKRTLVGRYVLEDLMLGEMLLS
jgi:hypothetical protein